MKKSGKVERPLAIAFGSIYMTISLVSWFVMPMVFEGTMDATDPLYIRLIDASYVIFFIVPLLCIAAAVASPILRRRGLRTSSVVAQILPPVAFVLSLLLLAFAEVIR